MAADDEVRVVDNQREQRFEIWADRRRAGLVDYGLQPGALVLIHTEIDPAFEGRGLGSRLIHDVLAEIRARGLRIVPVCPFVRAYLRRHPEERDIVRDP